PRSVREVEREREVRGPGEDGDTSTPEDGGPYPLNASEDRRAYHRWLHARRLPWLLGGVGEPALRRARTRAPLPATGRRAPLISVLVPVWRTPIWALERCVGSVLAQDFADWELVLCDDASDDPELSSALRSLRRSDRRITITSLPVNSGISAATNAALAVARGRFVAFLDHDDELAPEALSRFAAAIEEEPEADVLYSDEDKIDFTGERFDPLFKPEWSPDLLLSFAYLAHLTVIRRELVQELGGLRSAFDGSQDWDLALRATERARKIVHIAEVLYHWRTLPTSTSSGAAAKPWAYEAGLRVIEGALARRGEGGEVTQHPAFPGRYHVRRAIKGQPLVSIIVPFRDEPSLVATCATSLREAPGYDRVELVLVDNGSELPETAELLERLGRESDVRIVQAPGPFNWAAINNAAVREATGDVLLFANNDIEARVPRWLHALLGHAQRPEVGAVGARLLYPDGAIQHAGVVVGLGGIAGHVLRSLPADQPGYNSMAIQTRNCSVVTGACMMVRREVFESVGGFDERLPVAFNDVDFCLQLREKGYLVVYEPLAELVHHESKSRGHTDDLVEGRRILKRWAGLIAAGDPYHNANLSHWRYWCPLSTVQEDERWKTYLETSVSTLGSSSST
ncbi:MAG: glycosyl transferase family 2, partial [Acidimicrobiaceae bacterium]|nr:glycosyl transferase family 2 [Acidimicrobiaceae bacterium]